MNSETAEKRSIYIIEYSPKCFVVRDDEDNHVKALEELGGKWNRFLRDKETGDVFAGWIFYISKRSQIESWLNDNTNTENFIPKKT